jgi:hypothetical protein
MPNLNHRESERSIVSKPYKGTHYQHIQSTVSDPFKKTSLSRALALGTTPFKIQNWYTAGSSEALKAANLAAWDAQNRADRRFGKLKDVYAFAEPLLKEKLKITYGIDEDVKSTYLRLYFPKETPWYVIDTQPGYSSRTVSLLDAALHNFAQSETFTADSEFISKPDKNNQFDIKPLKTKMSIEQFKQLCRELDIGRQYNRYLRAFLLPRDEVAKAVLEYEATASQKAALNAAAHLALQKQDISANAFDFVQGIINGQSGLKLNGKDMQCCELSILDASLTGIVLFTSTEEFTLRTKKLIAYVPHDPEHPLKEYSSSEACLQELTRQLRENNSFSSQGSYWQFFSQFIDQQQRGHFFADLDRRLSVVKWHEKDPLDPGPTWRDTPVDRPRLEFSVSPLRKELWQHLYQRHGSKVINDAREIAVSTASADRQARWAWWDNFKKMLSDIFNAALMVAAPFVPGLGELMLAYTAYQLTTEVIEGVVDLAEGQWTELAEHVVGVVTDVIQLAAFGVGGAIGSEFRLKLSPFVEGLKPVTLPDGRATLWHPDLKPYELSAAKLPADSRPNALGLHQQPHHAVLPLDGKLYAVEPPSRTEPTHRIKHPERPNAYSPTLEHNGHGAWAHEVEDPRVWEGETLMRRVGHSVERFSPVEREQIRSSSGVDDSQLRRMHVEHAPPPPLLTDTIKRFSALDEVRDARANIRVGRPIDPQSVWFEPLLTQLPRWPVNRALRVFAHSDLSGPSRTYGNVQATGADVLSIGLPELMSGRLPDRVLAFLNEAEIRALLGPQTPHAERVQALREQLGNAVAQRQGDIARYIYQAGERSDSPNVQVLRQQFPQMPLVLADTLLADTTPAERQRMETEQRLPLAVKARAREVDFEGAITRAYDGFHQADLVTPDTEELALNTLKFFSDSFADLRIEVRDGTYDGPLRVSTGAQDAATVRRLIRDEHGRYTVLDEHNRALVTADDIYEAILHALSAQKRAQLGYRPGQGRLLKLWIMEKSAPPAERRRVMAQPPIRSVAPVEVDNLVRGPWWFFGTKTPEQRIKQLYPTFSERQVTAFLEQLRTKGDPEPAIDRLEIERGQLQKILNRWEGDQPRQYDANGELEPLSPDFVRNGGRHLQTRLLECFERKGNAFAEHTVHPDGGFTLDLSSEVLGPEIERWWKELRTRPGIDKYLEQITVLNLNRARYSTGTGGLLCDLPNLRQLSARDGGLTSIPAAIGELGQLRSLDLADNRIVLEPASLDQLGRLIHLQTLRLDGNPLRQPPDVGGMPGLTVLRLANTGLEDWPIGLFEGGSATKPWPRHFALDMRDCPIRRLPQVTPGSDQAFVLARSRFSTAQLSAADQARFGDYRASVGFDRQQAVSPRVENELAHWQPADDASPLSPSGQYTSYREESWQDVMAEPGARDFLKVIRRQRDSQDYRDSRSRGPLTQWVWQMIETMAVDSDLREELFRLADKPETGTDAWPVLFNRMGLKVLVSQAIREWPSAAALEINLVKLARSAARLERVGDLARAEISRQRQQHLIDPQANAEPDSVEVHRAYETGLANRLDLPWRSTDTVYETRAGVDQAKIDAAYDTIIERERGDGLVNGMIGLFDDPFWASHLRRTHPQAFAANDRLYTEKHAQLRALRETQKEWANQQDTTQTNRLHRLLEAQARALDIPEIDVFTGEEMTPWFFNRQVTKLYDEQNALARDLTREALTRAGL